MEINNKRVGGLDEFFVEIYNRESDAIFRFCLLRTSDREVALDFTQDMFMRFWKSLAFGKEIKNHRTFLFTIARNVIIDWYRKKKPFSLESLMENTQDGRSSFQLVAREDVEMETEAEFLIKKIGELPEPYSNAVYLRCVEELKPRDIAKILGESANVISVRISRGLERLREMLHIENAKANT
ncbi:MAG: sigma-70 family RNA polymerase sigma factor [bacterium]|nr:sigma-70 family RNA polymerase sigma factor [bacterium]